jgi:hypothetical protein
MKTNQNPTQVKNPSNSSFRRAGILWAIITVLAALWTLFLVSSIWAAEPVDLAELGRQGLGEASRRIIVTQSLAQRARPPLDLEFVKELAAYGGDDLALAYLEMDAATAKSAESPLPPTSARNMMAAGLAPADLIAFSKSLNPKLNNDDAEAQGGLAGPPAGAAVTEVMTVAEADTTTVAPTAPAAPKFEGQPNGPGRPHQPQANFNKPKDLRRVPQTLVPGQKADPSRPLPEAPGPYWTRAPKGHETFMGVTETVKADGHRYEVNTNARGGRLGQEVLSRPSGHKVVRYFSQSPERAMAAPAPNDFGGQSDYAYESGDNYYEDSSYEGESYQY